MIVFRVPRFFWIAGRFQIKMIADVFGCLGEEARGDCHQRIPTQHGAGRSEGREGRMVLSGTIRFLRHGSDRLEKIPID